MTWVDLLLALGVLFVALAGWRAGVIATMASFAGFLGGAMLGAWLTPRLLEGREVAGVVAAVRAGVTCRGRTSTPDSRSPWPRDCPPRAIPRWSGVGGGADDWPTSSTSPRQPRTNGSAWC